MTIQISPAQVEAALKGTKYEGSLKLWELAPATFTTEKEIAATDCLLNDARENTAGSLILESLLREVVSVMDTVMETWKREDEDYTEAFERVAELFSKENMGMLRPGKSEPMQCYYQGRDEERQEAWDNWIKGRYANLHATLARVHALLGV